MEINIVLISGLIKPMPIMGHSFFVPPYISILAPCLPRIGWISVEITPLVAIMRFGPSVLLAEILAKISLEIGSGIRPS
jgi:hypothetical protein